MCPHEGAAELVRLGRIVNISAKPRLLPQAFPHLTTRCCSALTGSIFQVKYTGFPRPKWLYFALLMLIPLLYSRRPRKRLKTLFDPIVELVR